MTNNVKTIYFGSGNFGLKTLETLVKNNFIPDLIITAPSESERFAKISPKLRIDSFENLKKEKNSLFIIASFGKILSKEILDIPKFDALNIHPSLLPELRGPSPIQTALLEGKEETGITIMLMDEKIDHGPILTQEKITINNNDDYLSLSEKLAKKGALLLLKILPDYLSGKIKPRDQKHDEATYAKILHKQNGEINWGEPAEIILRKIRALNPWPGTFAFFRDGKNRKQLLKILKAEVYDDLAIKTEPAEIIFQDKKLFVRAKDIFLELKEVQPEGKNPMSGEAFYRGHQKVKSFIL